MGRTLRFLFLLLGPLCGTLFVSGELYAWQGEPFRSDTLHYQRDEESFSLRVEPESAVDPDRVQTLRWSGWQWIQPLGSESGSGENRPRGAQLLQGVPDTLRTFPYQPLEGPFQVEMDESGSEWIVIGNPYTDPIGLNHIEPIVGELGSSSGYRWDRSQRRFRLLERGEQVEPGNLFLINRGSVTRLNVTQPDPLSASRLAPTDPTSRWIRFTLHNRVASTSAEATLQFDRAAQAGVDPLDLDAIETGLGRQEFPDSPKLYFQMVQPDTTRWFSRDARPYELELPMEVSLGFVSRRDSGPHRVEWEFGESLPESWNIELVDQLTQQRVDMRQRQSYSFDGEGAALAESTMELDEIRSLLLEEPFQRFQLRIVPPEDESHSISLLQTQQDPDKMELHANYPNPFSTETSIEFFLPDETPVFLNIYNVVGQRVAQLMNGTPVQGWHTETWNAGDLPSGIYILRLETPVGVLTRKMTLIR